MADSADTVDASTEAPKKPWGDDADFDAGRAWTLIQGLRSDKAALTDEIATLKTEKASVEQERDAAVKAAEDVQKELASDRREAILKEFDIDPDLAEEFLGGDLTLDELRRKAERLAGTKKPAEDPKEPEPKAPEQDSGAIEDPAPPKPPVVRPKPRPTPGEGASGAAPVDLDAIAAAARQR